MNRWHQAADCSQRRCISPAAMRAVGWHASICSLLHFSKGCHAFPLLGNVCAVFTRERPRAPAPAPAAWFCTGRVCGEVEALLPPGRSLRGSSTAPSVIGLREVRPICADDETTWQGHRGIVSESNEVIYFSWTTCIVYHTLIYLRHRAEQLFQLLSRCIILPDSNFACFLKPPFFIIPSVKCRGCLGAADCPEAGRRPGGKESSNHNRGGRRGRGDGESGVEEI